MILVTGCAGFIGSHLCERLLLEGYKVVGVDNFDQFYDKQIKLSNLSVVMRHSGFHFHEGNICDESTWELLKQYAVTCIVHLAAKAGVLPSLQYPKDYLKVNIDGTYEVLKFMQHQGIKNIVFGSSSSVYGKNNRAPFSEEDMIDSPISPYAFSKRSCELMLYTWHHLYQLNVICLRFFTVIGPRQRPDLAIRKFVTKILNNEPIEMYGEGDTLRDYTFVGDIVEGILSSIRFVGNKSNVYEIINLGNEHPVSLHTLIQEVYRLLDRTPHIIKKELQAGDMLITSADCKKANQLLNYSPKVSFSEGLKLFIDWYKQTSLT